MDIEHIASIYYKLLNMKVTILVIVLIYNILTRPIE